MAEKETFYGANAENPARARWAYLTVRESNQNAGFPSSCALVDSAILYKKKIYHSEVVSVVDIDRCNWVSLVHLV